MSERRFVLADLTHMSTTECLRIYEAGNMYTMPRAVAHASAKHELVARERAADWTPPSILRLPEVLTEADVVEGEAGHHRLRQEIVRPSGPALDKCGDACPPAPRIKFLALRISPANGPRCSRLGDLAAIRVKKNSLQELSWIQKEPPT
jgi:hypothetical protein